MFEEKKRQAQACLQAHHDAGWRVLVASGILDHGFIGGDGAALVATYRSEAAARAFLEALDPDIVAWACDLKQVIPGRAIVDRVRVCGQLRHSTWHAYAFAAGVPRGDRIWATRHVRDGEELLVTAAVWPRSLMLHDYQEKGCVLVTAELNGRVMARFWLDDYVTLSGALQRARFADQYQAVSDAYARTRARHEPATLLAGLASAYGDICMALKERLQFAKKTFSEPSSPLCHARGAVMRELYEKLGSVPAGRGLVQRVKEELPSTKLSGFAAKFGHPVGVLDAPCLPGCPGDMSAYRDATLCHPRPYIHSTTVERHISQAVAAGYRCSCRLLAGQLLFHEGVRRQPQRGRLDAGIAAALKAGSEADRT